MVRLICIKYGVGVDERHMKLADALRYTEACLRNRDYDRIELANI